jgi:hypothetical protein
MFRGNPSSIKPFKQSLSESLEVTKPIKISSETNPPVAMMALTLSESGSFDAATCRKISPVEILGIPKNAPNLAD